MRHLLKVIPLGIKVINMDALKGLIKYFKEHLFIILIFFGLVLLFGELVFDGKAIGGVLTSAGISVLAAGVFSGITKSLQYIGIFKSTLNEAVQEGVFDSLTEKTASLVEESLRGLHDIKDKSREEIWNYLTDTIYLDNLNGPSDDIRIHILNNFFDFPKAKTFFYERFRKKIDIQRVTGCSGKVSTTEHLTFTIIPPNKEPIVYEYLNYTQKAAVDDAQNFIDLELFKVNDKDVSSDLNVEMYEDDDNRYLYTKYSKELRGEESYKVQIKTKKLYDITKDNFKTFTTKKYIRDFEISLAHPDGMDVTCVPWGINPQTTSVGLTVHLEHDGLLFPDQGCIFIIK